MKTTSASESATNPPTYPDPQAQPERRPTRSRLAMSGSIALVNIAPKEAPTLPSTTHASARPCEARPGAANQSRAEPATHSNTKHTIHGLRGPPASAMAPSGGLSNAVISPLLAIVYPQ